MDQEQQRQQLIDSLANIADGIFVEHGDFADFGIQAAAAELRNRTDDQSIVRAALLKSLYGTVESLNLRNLFTLF